MSERRIKPSQDPRMMVKTAAAILAIVPVMGLGITFCLHAAPPEQAGDVAAEIVPAAKPDAAESDEPKRPSPRGNSAGRPLGAPGDGPREPGRRWAPPGFASTLPSDQEWNDINEFMVQHSPVRWQLAQQSLSQPGRSELPRRLIYGQYLELKRLESSDPDEYTQRVSQIELEDEIFKSETDLRDAESRQSGDVAELKAVFESKVKDHFDRELKAKEARISRLESQLRQQRGALENEKRRAERTLQQRIEMAHRLSEWFRGWASGEIRLPFPRRGPRPDEAPATDPTPAPAPDPAPAEDETR